jgi:hypothetical protein
MSDNIPLGIVQLTRKSRFAASVASTHQVTFWVAIFFACIAMLLIARTVSLFFKIGIGTPAPWNPPKKLVVKGPYR